MNKLIYWCKNNPEKAKSRWNNIISILKLSFITYMFLKVFPAISDAINFMSTFLKNDLPTATVMEKFIVICVSFWAMFTIINVAFNLIDKGFDSFKVNK